MLILIHGKFGKLVLWLFYFILLHILSLKTVASANIYANKIECYECFSHEKQCDSPIDPLFLPRVVCGQNVYGYNENQFLKRAFPFVNITTIQNGREYDTIRDKRQIDMYYNRGYSCLNILISGKESGTIRGCAPDGMDVCKLAKRIIPPQLRISSCETCKTDLCNSATGISLSIFMILISIITTLFSTY